MRHNRRLALAWLSVCGAALALPLTQVKAQYPCPPQPCPPPCVTPMMPPSPGQVPGQLPSTGQAPTTGQAPSTSTENQQQTAESQQNNNQNQNQNQNPSPERGAAVGGESLAQNIVGDFIGPGMSVPGNPGRTTTIPIGSRSAFKLADDDSALPQDRVFFNYNYFSGANTSANGLNYPRVDVNRETFGFEKTFFDGNASVELRLPIFQTSDTVPGVDSDGFGDLTIVLKYAFLYDRETGNVASGGLAVTAPTGVKEAVLADGSTLHDTLLQPWAGFLLNSDSGFFVEGLTSLVLPTDVRDVTIFFDDFCFGYWLYRDGNRDDCKFLTGIVPVFETHLNLPLDHRNQDLSPIFLPDELVLTSGTHFVFNHRSDVFVGAAVPVTGPKPFDYEVIAQLNFRF